jgi:hypothetical protein
MSQPRRSFLDELPPAPQEHVQSIPAPALAPPEGPKRPGRKPAHKRNRSWELTHPPVTFVGVPEGIREAVRDLAAHYREQYGMVGGVDAVARELLRYALVYYQAGILKMLPAPGQSASTLQFRVSNGSTARRIPARKPGKKKGKPSTVSYRLPKDLVVAIRAIPDIEQERAAPQVIHLPLGQVITRLLSYALDAYESGNLSLYTTPTMVVSGLAGEQA